MSVRAPVGDLNLAYEDCCIGRGIAAIDAQIRCNETESRNLSQLLDALLPKLTSGEIDVSKVDLTQLNNHLVEHCILFFVFVHSR